MKSKYGNKKCTALGMKFDSIGERDRYMFLLYAEKQGKIFDLRCQVSYRLDVNEHHICKYIADFVYRTRTNKEIVEDFKGMQTAIFKLKKKLMKAVHDIEINISKTATDQIPEGQSNA